MGVRFHAERGLQVCFTRSAEEAAYWPLLERDHEEGRGSIFAFDRRSLQYRYNIEPFHDDCWDNETGRRDEAEERIFDNITDIGKRLIGFVPDPTTQVRTS